MYLGFQIGGGGGGKYSLATSAYTKGAKSCFPIISYGEFFCCQGAMAQCLLPPKLRMAYELSTAYTQFIYRLVRSVAKSEGI